MPGARCARSLACKIKQAYEHSHHGHTGNHPAFPAQWFYGLLRALPGDQACLTPSPALLIADLTPASGRQNHTTWPYASALFVNCAAASTASRPAFVTIASRPSVGRDQIAIVLICPRRQAKIRKIGNWGRGGAGCCPGWAEPTGRANARPMINSGSPPSSRTNENGEHGASGPLPTLRNLESHRPASASMHSIAISIAGVGSAW